MPTFTVVCRGGLLTKAGLVPEGASVELSEKDAASLPPGTVAKSAAPEKPSAPVEAKPTQKSEAKASKDSKP